MATIVLAEDHQIVREGLRTLIDAEPDLSVVAATGDGMEAVQLVEEFTPDVLVVDLAMPGLNGLEVTRQVTKRAPGTRVVVLSMHNTDAYVVEAFRNGALAYVLKETGVDELVQAIHAVLRGERYLSAGLSQAQLEAYADEASSEFIDRYNTLTTREREVLQLTADGYTSPEIAEKLFISPRTADTHRFNLMAKLGLHNQTDLVRYALQRGLVPLRTDTPGTSRG